MPRKLNFEVAEEIRHKHFGVGFTQKELAFEYGVSQATISKVLLRQFYGSPPSVPLTEQERLAKFEGVCLRKDGRWQAYMYIEGRTVYLGTFDTEEAAAIAHRTAVTASVESQTAQREDRIRKHSK